MTAREEGVRLGLEPATPHQRDSVSFVNTVAEALDLLAEADLPDVGVMADTYNLWHEDPAALTAIADRVTGLHVADEPIEPGRTTASSRARAAGGRSRS